MLRELKELHRYNGSRLAAATCISRMLGSVTKAPRQGRFFDRQTKVQLRSRFGTGKVP
jgi:hypothetical protein